MPKILLQAAATTVVELRGLSFRYPGGEPVISGLDLTVPAGGRLALVGENGSGKSTLLKLIAGVLPAPKGSIGLGTDGWQGLGYVGQSLFHDRDFPIDVAEVVADGLIGLRLTRRERRRRVERGLADVGLTGLERRSFACLSGGQRQRVLVARALVSEPSVLLLDEPTAGLDQAASAALLAVLERVCRGRTLIFSSHRPRVVQRLAERQLLLPEQRVRGVDALA